MAAWITAANLPAAEFRKLVIGREMTTTASASLQAMAKELAVSTQDGSPHAAGEHLAAAVADGKADEWLYRFASAQGTAIYAGANGLLPIDNDRFGASTVPAINGNIVVAAAGDLKCEGYSGACQSGGSWGSLSGSEQAKTLLDFER